MTPTRIRVVKVGGSLLECESLPQLLTNWLARVDDDHSNQAGHRTARTDILVAGGGALVDQVRQLDKRFSLDAESAHWMSVSAMCCTSRLLARLLHAGQPVQRWNDLQAMVAGERPSTIVFDVQQWLKELEAGHPGERLTRDWRTTSDSIAARLAQVLRADELVLLKSTDLSPDIDWRAAAAQGLVDEHFPHVASELPRVVWINLRKPDASYAR